MTQTLSRKVTHLCYPPLPLNLKNYARRRKLYSRIWKSCHKDRAELMSRQTCWWRNCALLFCRRLSARRSRAALLRNSTNRCPPHERRPGNASGNWIYVSRSCVRIPRKRSQLLGITLIDRILQNKNKEVHPLLEVCLVGRTVDV